MKTFFPKHFSYTQEFTKLKTLISISILAHETEISVLAKRKLTSIIAKKISFSSRFTVSLGCYVSLFSEIHKICEKHWAIFSGDRCFQVLQSSCTEQQRHNALLINLCRLSAPGKFALKWHDCFQQPKIHTHRCYQEEFFDNSFATLLPVMANSGQICVHSCTFMEILWEVQLISGLVYASYQTSQRLLHFCAKNNYTYKLGNGEEKPTHDFQTPKLNSVNGPNCSWW